MKPTSRIQSILCLAALASGTLGCDDFVFGDPDFEEPAARPRTGLPREGPAVGSRILVDASHDGGLWWFPQVAPFFPDSAHQGKYLADYLRSLGHTINEVPRGSIVTDSLLQAYEIVFRAGNYGLYRDSELEAYSAFLARPTTLILLSEYRRPDRLMRDELAEMLGLGFDSSVTGLVTRFAPHPLTHDVAIIEYIGGAILQSWDESRVEILGWVEDSIPVMGVLRSDPSRVFFIGDGNGIELVPQPFVDNLIEWVTGGR